MRQAYTYMTSFDKKYYSIILLIGLIGMVILYMYMISMSVVNVVMNKELQQSIAVLESDITELEAVYIARQYDFDKEKAIALGYVKNNNKVFLATNNTNLVVTRNER